MAQNKVHPQDTTITGTRDGTKFLRDDWTWQPAPVTAFPPQITITTAVSITTDTVDGVGAGQKGKNVVIDNGVNPINITVNGGVDFVASYLKHGTGAITFVAGSGRTLAAVNGTAIMFGAPGTTATISSIGTKDYLKIDNV
jgi:hypothetical protein